MKVLVSGATGAIGRFLVPQLVEAGHEVVGLTRSPAKVPALGELGARGVVVDALDPAAVRAVVLAAEPDAVIDELTALPRDFDLRDPHLYDANDEVRSRGTPALHSAAKEAGARRFVMQSIAFLYAPGGDPVKSEDAAPWTDAPMPFARSVRILVDNERRVVGDAELAGVVLRYGLFYGPDTYYARDGSVAEQVRRRRYPIVGGGHGLASLVHLQDAASATVAALQRGRGIYNIVDDDPAPGHEWLPAYARAIGAKAPLRVPAWAARLAGGPFLAAMATRLSGASNARAKQELAWTPALPSWREGFATALDGPIAER